MSKNIIDSIWDSHVIRQEEGSPDMLFLDMQLLHEVTSPQAFSELRKHSLRVFDPERNIATLDHSLPTNLTQDDFADEQNKTQLDTLRKNCLDFGITLHDINSGNQGIVHVTGPELGLTQPGMTLCCGDSHTSTHGAFGVLAFGVGTTQIFHVMASSCLLLDRPKTMKIVFTGTPSKYFSAKDAILKLIAQIGVQGGTGYALEYCGDFIKNCSMEERMTICNMSIECGARFGLISPDETTFEFLKNTGRFENIDFENAVKTWKQYASASDAAYDMVVEVNIENAQPMITWGTTPGQGIEITQNIPSIESLPPEDQELAKKSLEYTKLRAGQPIIGTPIEHVFIGSCTNSRITDLEIVANILQNRKIHPKIRMFIVPGSEKTEQLCKERGYDIIFKNAGADFRRPGCSMCLAMNGDHVPAGERCVSTSNRNFVGRQGKDSITHLASPLVATCCAIAGEIVHPSEIIGA